MKLIKMFIITMSIVFLSACGEKGNQSSTTSTQSTGLNGIFRCSFKVVVDMNSGRESFINGDEITTIFLSGPSGLVTHTSGKKESLTFSRINKGPVATGHIYLFDNSEVFESIQMNIDNEPNEKRMTAALMNLKSVANTKMSALGSCTY